MAAEKTCTSDISSTVACYNLHTLMRPLFGAGTSKEVKASTKAVLFIFHGQDTVAIAILTVFSTEITELRIAISQRT